MAQLRGRHPVRHRLVPRGLHSLGRQVSAPRAGVRHLQDGQGERGHHDVFDWRQCHGPVHGGGDVYQEEEREAPEGQGAQRNAGQGGDGAEAERGHAQAAEARGEDDQRQDGGALGEVRRGEARGEELFLLFLRRAYGLPRALFPCRFWELARKGLGTIPENESMVPAAAYVYLRGK